MDSFPWDHDYDTPQQDAMRAIGVFLEGVNFRVKWCGHEEMVIGRYHRDLLLRGGTLVVWWKLGFVKGELFLRRLDYNNTVTNQVDLDCGGAYFELSDPGCFDQIVVALVERLDG